MVARQPLGGVRESRPPRLQPRVHLLSRTEKEIPGVRRVLQRFRAGLRSKRQISLLSLAALFLSQLRPARSAIQLLQHGRSLRRHAEGRGSFSVWPAERRGESRRRKARSQRQGRREKG